MTNHSQNFVSSLLHPELGLDWIFPLVKFRSVQTRASALSILSSLTSSVAGCRIICDAFENEIWSVLTCIGLDDDESSFVRSLAFNTLNGLLKMLPKVNTASPILGVTFLALLSRMQQCKFYSSIAQSLQNYVHCEMPHDESMAPVSPLFVTSVCEFLTSLLEVAEQGKKF